MYKLQLVCLCVCQTFWFAFFWAFEEIISLDFLHILPRACKTEVLVRLSNADVLFSPRNRRRNKGSSTVLPPDRLLRLQAARLHLLHEDVKSILVRKQASKHISTISYSFKAGKSTWLKIRKAHA